MGDEINANFDVECDKFKLEDDSWSGLTTKPALAGAKSSNTTKPSAVKTLNEDGIEVFSQDSLTSMNVEDKDVESQNTTQGRNATVMSTTANIVKCTVGAGILVLPKAFQMGGLIIGTVILLTVCITCAYGFYLLGQSCEKCDAYGYDELLVEALGPKWKGTASWLVFILCFMALVIYAMLCGMFFGSSLKAAAAMCGGDMTRWAFMDKSWQYVVVIGTVVILPLSFLKDLDSLRFTSLVGVGIVFYGCTIVFLRFIMTWTWGYDDVLKLYRECPMDDRTKLMTSLNYLPRGSGLGIALNIIGSLNTMAAASNCHFNAPGFYKELKERNLNTYYKATLCGFGIVTVFNVIMAFSGYFAFGVLGVNYAATCVDMKPKDVLDSLVLNSFLHENNVGISEGWQWAGLVGIVSWAMCIALGYPLIFNACRSAMFDIFTCLTPTEQANGQTNEPTKRYIVTAVTVPTACIISALCVSTPAGPDIAFNLFGLLSATVGNLVTYILPAYIWIRLNPKLQASELKGCYTLLTFGIVFSLTGLVQNGIAWYELITGHKIS